jgi:hypothetical protein
VADALGVLVLVALGGGVVGLRAVLDGARVGVPASIAVLAPVSEVGRALRARPAGRRAVLPVVGGAGLLVASVLRVVALPGAGGAPLAVAVAGFVVADAVWWVAGAILGRGGARSLARAAAVEAPLLLALAVPVVAGRGTVPLGVEAPVALLLLVAGGVLLPLAIGPLRAGPGAGRLLVGAGLATQPVSAAAVAAALLLPAGTAWLVGSTVVLTAIAVLADRRVPALRPPLVARLALRVLLPLAAVQLAVVVALTLLAA